LGDENTAFLPCDCPFFKLVVPFFLAPLPADNGSAAKIQASCRPACANISNDHAHHLGGYVAWILTEEEEKTVFELTKTFSSYRYRYSYFVFGGNR
jgi:hypothetical protein